MSTASAILPTYLDVVLNILRERREATRLRYGVDLVGVFGSVARGEDTYRSDVDVLISTSDRTDMFDLGAVWSELADALNRRVDLVDRAGLHPELRESVERELAPL